MILKSVDKEMRSVVLGGMLFKIADSMCNHLYQKLLHQDMPHRHIQARRFDAIRGAIKRQAMEKNNEIA